MLGFVTALSAELASGAPVAKQLELAPIPIGLTFLLFAVASLVPILRVCPRWQLLKYVWLHLFLPVARELSCRTFSQTLIVQGQPREGGEFFGGVPQFTPDAELVNGRTAMVGFALLLLLEAIKGSAVF